LSQEESDEIGPDEITQHSHNNISTEFYRHTEATSNHKNTPQRPRTLTNRKNLSRSFNMLTNCSDEDDDIADEMSMVVTQRAKKAKSLASPSRTFHRMDSGFNDEDYSTSQTSTSVDDSSRLQVLGGNFICEEKENLVNLGNTSSATAMLFIDGRRGRDSSEDCDVSMQSNSDNDNNVNFMCSTPSKFV
jgi:hypothetical protein